MDLNNCGSKVVVSRRLFLSRSLSDNRHTIVLTQARMKQPKDTNSISFECDYFIKTPIVIKGGIITVYIKEHHSDCEYIIKYSKFQWRFLRCIE